MNKKLSRNTEIDTRAPFRSVKEAVSLFGDKVLAGELYANVTKLKHQVSWFQALVSDTDTCDYVHFIFSSYYEYQHVIWVIVS